MKTVDYVLFSDSTIKAATNAQQWYVTISRGRRGIRIFKPDKEQLRENVARSGHRPLAMELATGFVPRRGVRLWDRLHGHPPGDGHGIDVDDQGNGTVTEPRLYQLIRQLNPITD